MGGSISVAAKCEQTAGRRGAKTSNVGENFSFVTSQNNLEYVIISFSISSTAC